MTSQRFIVERTPNFDTMGTLGDAIKHDVTNQGQVTCARLDRLVYVVGQLADRLPVDAQIELAAVLNIEPHFMPFGVTGHDPKREKAVLDAWHAAKARAKS